MKRKFIKGLLAIVLGVASMTTFAACEENGANSNSGNENGLYALQIQTVYAMAQEAGFDGTLEELVAMFKGEKGLDGVSVQSANVENGKLYLTLSNGNIVDCGDLGIENGIDGVNGQDGKTPTIGENGNWFIDGEDTGKPAYVKGDKGDKGDKGQEGDDGVGVEEITLIGTVGLVDTYEIEYTDGRKTTFTVTNAKSIEKTEIVDGNLIIYYNNDTKENVGKVVGENGSQGEQGEQGEQGVGIEKVEINNKGELIVTLTNGTPINCGVIKEQTHVHTFGEWLSDTYEGKVDCTNRLFYHICSSCKTIEWKKGESSDHKWTTVTTEPNCQKRGYNTNTCEICSKVTLTDYTNKIDCIWAEEYAFDNLNHWLECTMCDEIKDKEAHTSNGEGVCSICEYPESETVGVLYKVVDGEAKVVGYEGIATKICIASEYEGVPVTEIGEKAFYGQKSLKSVEIPNTVKKIGDWAFRDCTALAYAVIPEGVLEIGKMSFRNCDSLESVVIPNSVTSMGKEAFRACNGLKNLVIGDGITTIEDWAFYNCNVLTDLTIGKNVKTIGNTAFCYCESLTNVEIPDGVTTIEEHAFSWCIQLKNIVIPNSVTTIEENAFWSCNALQYNVYNNAKYLGNAGNGYVACVGMMEDATDLLLHKDVKAIAVDAFSGCNSLINIKAAEDSSVFQTIDGNLYSKDGKTLVKYAFGKTEKTMEIPQGVTKIENDAYYGSENLTNIVIPDSVTTIGNRAFCGLNLTDVEIPYSVTSIGVDAFYACCNLTAIKVDENNTAYKDIDGVLYTKDGTTLIQYPIEKTDLILIVPEGVITISAGAFSENHYLTSVVLPEGVLEIGDFAFNTCDSLFMVSIPQSVTTLGEYAFTGIELSFDGWTYDYLRVYYGGTLEEWEQLLDGSEQNYLEYDVIELAY